MVVMARLSRPDRPDLVFVSPRRGRGWPVWEHPGLDTSGVRGLAVWSVWAKSLSTRGQDIQTRLARSKCLEVQSKWSELRVAVEVRSLGGNRSARGGGRGIAQRNLVEVWSLKERRCDQARASVSAEKFWCST